jgi:hypothetical protein
VRHEGAKATMVGFTGDVVMGVIRGIVVGSTDPASVIPEGSHGDLISPGVQLSRKPSPLVSCNQSIRGRTMRYPCCWYRL